MRLSRWLLVIGIMIGVGCLRVAQRNAVLVKSYAVGERMHRLHEHGNDVAWLQTQVTELSSPTHLARTAEERRLQLVAWSRLPLTPTLISMAPERHDGPTDE